MKLTAKGRYSVTAVAALAARGADACVSLRDLSPQIVMDEDVRLASKVALDRMLDMSAGNSGGTDLGPKDLAHGG